MNDLSRRLRLLEEAFELMGDGGVFVQFTYGVKSPIPPATLAGRYVARCGAPVLRNLPPAGVWTYRRRALAVSQLKIGTLIQQAEQFAAQIAVKRTLAEKIVRQQGHRVPRILAREAGEMLDRLRDRSREL